MGGFIDMYNIYIDQKLLDEKVDAARDIMKQNAIAIQQMEGKNDVHGFSLKGLTATDLYNNTNTATK